jgi:hypothetical protein
MISPMVTKLISDYIADSKTSNVLDKLSLNRFKDYDITQEYSVVG